METNNLCYKYIILSIPILLIHTHLSAHVYKCDGITWFYNSDFTLIFIGCSSYRIHQLWCSCIFFIVSVKTKTPCNFYSLYINKSVSTFLNCLNPIIHTTSWDYITTINSWLISCHMLIDYRFEANIVENTILLILLLLLCYF